MSTPTAIYPGVWIIQLRLNHHHHHHKSGQREQRAATEVANRRELFFGKFGERHNDTASTRVYRRQCVALASASSSSETFE